MSERQALTSEQVGAIVEVVKALTFLAAGNVQPFTLVIWSSVGAQHYSSLPKAHLIEPLRILLGTFEAEVKAAAATLHAASATHQ